jgi:hypothetical protein
LLFRSSPEDAMRIPALLLAGAVFAFGPIDGLQAQSDGTPGPVSKENAATENAATENAATENAATAPAAAPAPASAVAPAAAPAERVAAADAPAKATSAEPVAAADQVVCRTQVETGTIGRRNKICMTRAEWEQHRQASRKYLRAINQSRSTQPGGESLGP